MSGRALAPLLRRRWSCEVWPIPSTTLLTEFEEFHRPGKEYFWISFSRSGESPEGVALLEQALGRHLRVNRAGRARNMIGIGVANRHLRAP